MTFGVSEEHGALHAAARRWVGTHCDREVVRQALDSEPGWRPPCWDDLAKQGWVGLAVSEANGGEGYGLLELAVVLSELGRGLVPGPFLPTALTAAVLDRWADPGAAPGLLAGLLDGTTIGATAVGSDALRAEPSDGDPRLMLRGTLAPVLAGALPDVLLVPVERRDRGADDREGAGDRGETWCVLRNAEVDLRPLAGLDPTRTLVRVAVGGALVPGARCFDVPAGAVAELAVTLAAAEATGGMAWCVDTAADHARNRVQFGRPIGQFQAVKHRCADMLVALEMARAVAWDAAMAADAAPPEEASLAAAVAGAVVPAAFLDAAKDCIQVLGGIGYTWEHDAHLFLKRATAGHQLSWGAHRWRARVAAKAVAGDRRALGVQLPPEAEEYRAEVRSLVDDLRSNDRASWNRLMADTGYLAPAWPRPWGRDAGPVEQLVIDAELRSARVRRPHLQVGAWVLPTLIVHGTAEQQARWIPPSLRGEVQWCQLFSEPGAGSDLASLTTRGERTEGGWLLSGQKVWTTLAHQADVGLCLARTDPGAPKHQGITCFVVDMRSPGIDVRPLRELTGQEMFNEVFLEDVVVPDDAVIGPVHGGWECARTTLANERVSMGSGSSFGPGVESLLDLVERRGAARDPVLLDEVGAIVAEAQAVAVLGLRTTLRALAGAEPGPESSVRKLLGVEHDQRLQEVALTLLGADGAVDDGEAAGWLAGFLGNRALSIAGGTSDIQRNVIAERLLGLPRDP